MGRLEKTIARSYLDGRDWQGLCHWADAETGALRAITSLLFSVDPLLRWRAVEAVGYYCGWKAKNGNSGVARRLIRRLLWGMNDESGSIIWNAPEAIAEIVVHVQSLIPKFVPILISNIALEPFPRGVHWSLARISGVTPSPLENARTIMYGSLDSDDPFIRAHGAVVLGHLQDKDAVVSLRKLLDDRAQFEVYDIGAGVFQTAEVAAFAEQSLRKIT
jgi:hypothetical protein